MANDAGIARGAAALDAASKQTRSKKARFPRVWLDEAQPSLDGGYLVKGVIERGKLAVIYGPPGEGKTFFGLDLAAHVASGLPWRGRRVRPGLVVYVAAEAGGGILRRFVAWRDRHLSEAREGRVPLAIITRAINLLNIAEVNALLDELRALAAEVGVPVGLVVFDTLSRSIPGGDENHSEDMTRVVAAADAIRDELGAATAIVHHSGKDASKGTRGHSSLLGAADTVIAVAGRVATVEKVRDGTAGEQFAFGLEVVDLGTDADGDKVTTCVVRPLESAPSRPREAKLTGAGKIALQALQEAVGEQGRVMPGSSTIPRGVRAVEIAQWRARFKLRYGTDDEGEKRAGDAVKKAFRRAREELAKVGAVAVSDPFVWPS
jgi:KaiC/GvpD/RAD55 family RecA-like ATPase